MGVMTLGIDLAKRAKEFANGRHLAAWLGLVPRQCSRGGKERLLGSSKWGDRYLRTLPLHGARVSAERAWQGYLRRPRLWQHRQKREGQAQERSMLAPGPSTKLEENKEQQQQEEEEAPTRGR